MTSLRITPARWEGRERLYVSLPNGRHVAWYDSARSEVGAGGGGGDRVDRPDGAESCPLPALLERAPEDPVIHPGVPAMGSGGASRLREPDQTEEPVRSGHGSVRGGIDCSPVASASGGGRISLVFEGHREAVLTVLAPYLTGDWTIGPPPVPTSADLARLALHPDDDLAPNRPGEALHAEADRIPLPTRRLARNPRRATLARLAAHQTLGSALDVLEETGWRILHAVPLAGGDRVDHLAIGPGGVLAVHTLPARRLRLHIADPQVRTGRGGSVPLLRLTRRRADQASLALATAVRPVLVVVGAGRLTVQRAPTDVWILREGEVTRIGGLGTVHKPADIEALYALARDRRTWLRS
ncbi:nuclease-related domain-containing protein [Streptomyces albipurpureus]|uniref:NERD domain-containing protein n=1 Tax=Streptomyces albipurpureus TaxID=2897419 RepID=A0ABT0UJ13_9ACTN|nr:nuclease-related domain-containing protein [Streptomyces sp. CWNU-1]MCM2387984.1 NERD domain-containing protein [Streptomyces sp. CWNU-1]